MSDMQHVERISPRRVWEIVAKWRFSLLVALVSILAGGGISILPPLILRRLIDVNLAEGRAEGLFQIALGYLGATLVVHLTTFVTAYTTSVAAQGALKGLRIRLFDHLQKLPVSYYDNNPIGDVISRCTSDMETINALFSSGVISLLAELVRIVFTFGAMVALSIPLSIALIVTLPFLVLFTRRYQLLMRTAQRALRVATGTLNARLHEYLSRIGIIKSLNWSVRVVQQFRQTLAQTLRVQNRSIGYGAAYDPVLKIFQAVLVAVFLIAGTAPGAEFLRVSVGTLTAFVLLFDQFFGPLIRIGSEWQVVQGALAGLERVFQILSIPEDKVMDSSEDSLETYSKADRQLAVVENLTFGYVDRLPILSNITLNVEAGTHVAIVGRTGAGKSTLINLLGGLYHPWEGRIRVCGIEPGELSTEQRSRILGTVPQSGWIFTGSIADNFTLWDDTIPRHVIERAARISGAHEFISRLPLGYETIVGESSGADGVRLSAGEQQLLALGRALTYSPAVLMLDEATASVDGATEAAFRGALRAQLEQRRGAVITVAHRISTAMAADRIIVLENGRIVEEGTPAQLTKNGGHFAALWEMSKAGWDWRDNGKL